MVIIKLITLNFNPRSQSTHSKRSPLPSLQETPALIEADYVNTDIINDLINESSASTLSEDFMTERPKSVAEICQNENVCNIKIKANNNSENEKANQPPIKAKRSASTVSTSTAIKAPMANNKASRLLGIDENCTPILDSGRFSMGSSLSPGNEKKAILTQRPNNNGLLKSEDKTKFKSLGDLHMEKGLPTVLVHQ